MIDHAERSFDIGNEYPYDAPDGWRNTTLPPVDWAHQAARGILYDLGDRGGIKHAFNNIDQGVRVDIVEALAAIIRAGYKRACCEWTKDPDDEYMPDTWDSACGEKWTFIEGGPVENSVRFCQGCGKTVKLASAPTTKDTGGEG